MYYLLYDSNFDKVLVTTVSSVSQYKSTSSITGVQVLKECTGVHINVCTHRSAEVHFVNTGGWLVSGGWRHQHRTTHHLTTDIGADEEASTLNIHI